MTEVRDVKEVKELTLPEACIIGRLGSNGHRVNLISETMTHDPALFVGELINLVNIEARFSTLSEEVKQLSLYLASNLFPEIVKEFENPLKIIITQEMMMNNNIINDVFLTILESAHVEVCTPLWERFKEFCNSENGRIILLSTILFITDQVFSNPAPEGRKSQQEE